MRKLCVLLTDPLKAYHDKGEIKARYYNPCNYFEEVHVISFCDKDIDDYKVKLAAGNAILRIYPIGRLTFFSFLAIKSRLLRLIRNIRPDVVRAYDPSLRGALAVYTARKLGLPVVISLHYHPDDQRKFDSRILLRFRILLEHYVMKFAAKVICVTDYVKSYAQKYGAKDAVVIYNRVDPEQFKPTGSGNNRSKKLILSIGRLERQKYQECIIMAVKDLDVKLTLIGQGKRYSFLKRLCRRLNIEDKVTFLASVSNSDIQKYYWECGIFALATHYEGFCIPIVEAMASGAPVVASDIPPIREIGQGPVRLVRNDPASFREAFLELLDNDERKKKMSYSGQQLVKDKFDYYSLENAEKGVYENLIANEKRMER